jgi:hypothetical protein
VTPQLLSRIHTDSREIVLHHPVWAIFGVR